MPLLTNEKFENRYPFINRIINRIKSSNIASRLAKGAFWSLTGTALAKFIVLISGIICAHVLEQEAYGEFNMVRSTINLFVVFGNAGLGLTATKYISEYKKKDKNHICSIYLLTNGFAAITGLIVTVLILALSNYLATETLKAPQLITPIRIGALLLFITVINGAQQGTLAGFEGFRSIACNTFLGSVAESILLLIGGYYWGVNGAVLGFGCGFIVLYICNHISIRKQFAKNCIQLSINNFKKNDLHLLYKFSLPAALSSIMVAPVFWAVRTMLVRHTNFSELAIYEAADQWKIIILFIPAALSNVLLPILSSISNSSEKEKYWKTLKYNIYANVAISSSIALLVCITSPYIMVLYGKGFTDPWPLILLAISTIFTSISTVVGISISSRAKMWVGFLFNFIWGIMVILFSYIFLNMGLGARAVGLSILISYFLHAICQFFYLYNSVRHS